MVSFRFGSPVFVSFVMFFFFFFFGGGAGEKGKRTPEKFRVQVVTGLEEKKVVVAVVMRLLGGVGSLVALSCTSCPLSHLPLNRPLAPPALL